jgi:hypothetical protein
MNDPIIYQFSHSTGTVELALSQGRFMVKTHGTGLADRLKTIDFPLSDLLFFALVPTVVAQNLSGTRAHISVDNTRDAEFIISYSSRGNLKKKRLFVASKAPAFQAILGALRELRPDASLLDLPPKEAFKKIGVLSPRQAILVVVAVAIGIPLVVAIVATLVSVLT